TPFPPPASDPTPGAAAAAHCDRWRRTPRRAPSGAGTPRDVVRPAPRFTSSAGSHAARFGSGRPPGAGRLTRGPGASNHGRGPTSAVQKRGKMRYELPIFLASAFLFAAYAGCSGNENKTTTGTGTTSGTGGAGGTGGATTTTTTTKTKMAT